MMRKRYLYKCLSAVLAVSMISPAAVYAAPSGDESAAVTQ